MDNIICAGGCKRSYANPAEYCEGCPDNPTTAKSDTGKLPVSFVPPEIIRDIAEIRAYGNKKYHSPDNWKKVQTDRYWDALLRHVLACWNNLEAVDEESGFPHLWHIACNLAFILEQKKGEFEKHRSDERN
jgi:hypothetical protein